MTQPPIFILGEARGEAEDRLNTSFVGPSGIELLRQLHSAEIIALSPRDRRGIDRYYTTNDSKAIDSIWARHADVVFRTNVFNLHPPSNNLEHLCGPKSAGIPGYPALLKSKYVLSTYSSHLERLSDEIISCDPNVILCLGNCALWALAGRTGITKYRGTTLLSSHTISDYKLLPSFHPAAVLRQPELRPTAIADLMKALHESTTPEIVRPTREIWIDPTLDDIREFTAQYIRGCELLSVDIETSGQRITCIGFAPSPAIALVVPLDDSRAKSGSYWETREDELRCWALIRSILEDSTTPKLFQNGLYDIAFLYKAYGIRVANAAEDTMLLHHALQPESLKGLGYLGSIYTDEGAWKHFRTMTETIKRED